MVISRRVFDQAKAMLEGLKSVDNTKLPKEINADSLKKVMDQALEMDAKRIEAYKAWRKAVDQAAEARVTLHKAVIRTKGAVRGIFGPDSLEYQAVGGKRTSERKRPSRASTTPDNPSN